jgi:DNA-binding MarR family transcriptional regulator
VLKEVPDHDELLGTLDRALRKLNASLVLFSQEAAERLGINVTDLHCLNLLALTGPISAGRLAELTGLTTGAITGVVDRLERAGFARRDKDAHDRRRVIVRLVPEQQDRVASLFEPLRREAMALYASYSDRELDFLLDVVTRSWRLVQQEIAKLRAEAEAAAPAKKPR